MNTGSISRAQLARLHTALSERQVADRDSRLRVLSYCAGRSLDSSRDLTGAEAHMCLDMLANASHEQIIRWAA